MTLQLPRVFVSAITLTACITSVAAQTTVSVVCDRDNSLYENPTGSLSNGQGFLFVGKTGMVGAPNIRRMLLHFDVAGSVPAGAKIISADLQLFVAQSSAFLPIDTDVHRISQDWGEGASLAVGAGGGGAPAAPGDVTWIHTFSPSSLWNNSGGDFDPVPSWSFPLPSLGPYQSQPLPGLIADAQAWLDNPAQNFGWLFKTDEQLTSTARRLNSRESNINKPILNVTYLLPGETGTVGVGCPVGTGNFTLDLVGTAAGGNTVQIDYSNAPTPSLGADLYSLDVDPVGFQLFPSCSVYLPLTQPIIGGPLFLTSGGVATSSLAVPFGFPGFLVVVQGAVLDATPFSVSLSNAGAMLLQ